MIGLYVVSTEVYSGKTGMVLSIINDLRARGHNVSYMKPVGNLPVSVDGRVADQDAVFVSRHLGLSQPLEITCPVVLSAESTKEQLLKGEGNTAELIKSAWDEIAATADVVVMEGSAHINDGRLFAASATQLAEMLDLRVLLVTKIDNPFELADDALVARDRLGPRLLGIVCNWVQSQQMEALEGLVKPFLERQDINVYGLIPREQRLLAVTVRELVQALDGEVLCAFDRLDEQVETFMVGAMGQEQALRFFQRRSHKAVITGGDRGDVQLAALETPTKCLILTGNSQPSPAVLGVAEIKQVPMVLVNMDTLTAVEKTESILGRVRVHDDKKLAQVTELLHQHVDLERLYRDAGL